MQNKEYLRFQVISIMICFFVMGSIEMVGIASNYIKVTLHISDAKASLLPSLVYIWFVVCTIPTGLIMNKIGRKRTVLLSMSVMAIAMFIPMFGTSYELMVFSFILLGISNVCMQSSLYPLMSHIIVGKRLADSLTLGQFVKTLSSFSAPYVAMLGAVHLSHLFDLKWRLVFLFYFALTLIAVLTLTFSGIENVKENQKSSTYLECFRLLKDRFILLSFIGIMCHVGLDISTNTVAPKILMYRLDIVLEKASFGASLYFIARLVGCFLWTILLKRVKRKYFFFVSVGLIAAAMIGLYFAHSKAFIFVCIAMIGLGNANLFPVLFSQAVLSKPDQRNVISVLMIMGQAGGAIFPICMGLAFDKVGLVGPISVLMVSVAYLIFYTLVIRKRVDLDVEMAKS